MSRASRLALLICAALSGCTTNDSIDDVFTLKVNELSNAGKPLPAGYTRGKSPLLSSYAASGPDGVTIEGSGNFVSRAGPSVSTAPMRNGEQGYSLNLVNASIAAAAKSVLGDIMGASYVVDPRVTGTVTLQTDAPVSKDALADLLESALSVNGAVIVKRSNDYRIVPSSEAFSSVPSVSGSGAVLKGPGVKVQVIGLKFVAADEMKSILEPISQQGSVLRTDPARNLIVLAGNGSDLAAMREAISVFDVDWMQGMSVALTPLKASKPAAVAKELDTIFATDTSLGKGVIRFIPNDRLNSVLVITSRPAYIARARAWIAKLDRLASSTEQQLFVYQIQNRPAKELANVLQSVLKAQDSGSSKGSDTASLAPDLQPATASSSDGQTAQTSAAANATPSMADAVNYDPAAASATGRVKTSVVADTENNALLISTTEREYERVQLILRQLDVQPTQVMLEAVIAEVTLNDQLKFGLRWFLENSKFGVGFSDLSNGGTGASFPGFAWSYSANDISVTLNALSSITKVNVVSAPTLMALNNQKATLQVGDQVPIVTQQAASVNGNSPVINSIELKDTGVILAVIPHVNSSGRVMLEIDQEVSDVVKTTSSGIDSPTIRRRKISTRVLVNDNETVTLGGLIQQKNSTTRNQTPVLGNIPILGNAFRQKDDLIGKTELVIFIRPRIVRDATDARDVTEEFRRQLDFGSATKQRAGGKNDLQRDLKRIAY